MYTGANLDGTQASDDMAFLHTPGQQDLVDPAKEGPGEEAGAEENNEYETVSLHLGCAFPCRSLIWQRSIGNT
jgi:hypothetical protein